MSRLSKYVKEKIVKVLVAALVVGTVAGNGTLTVQAAELNVADPFQFVIYTNEYSNTGASAGDHVEGNVAIGRFGEVKSNDFVVYKGESYIGDFSSNTAKVRFNIAMCTLVLPKKNTDETENELVNNGGNWQFNIKNGDTVIRSFEAGNYLQSYEYRDNILQTIADSMEGIKGVSANMYALNDCDTEQMYVLNLTAEQFRNGAGSGNRDGGLFCKIKSAARNGKTVVVNIPDEVVDLGWCWMNANAEDSNGQYAAYASNIFWNFGNATNVKVVEIMGNILAPNATIQNDGTVIGSIIANRVVQNGQVHKTQGTVPTPPAPSTEPGESTSPAPSTEPSESTSPAPSTEPSESTSPAPSTEPSESTSPAPSTEPSESTSPAPSTEPSESTSPAPSTEPSESTSPAPSTEPSESTSPAPSIEPSESTSPAPSTEPSESTSPAPSIEPSESTSPAPSTEPGESTSPAPSIEPSESTSPAPSTEPSESASPAPSTEPSESTSPAPSTEPGESTSPAPSIEPSESASPAPSTEPGESTSPAPSTEPSVTPSTAPTAMPSTTPDNNPTPTPTPDTPDTTPTPDDPGTPDDPSTPEDPVTPETPQVLGARRRRMVTIEDDPTPLSDRAVLGASRRPQTGDASDAWNLGFALSLTGLGAWLIFKKKQ